MKVRDTQRQKVYDWEAKTLPSEPTCTEEEALKLVDVVRRGYGLTRVDIRWGGLRYYAGKAYYSRIVLHSRGVPRWVVLHELGHVIMNQRCTGKAGHGPEWMRVFLDLLARHAGLTNLRPQQAKIKVALKSKVPQPVRTVRERAIKPPRKRCPKHQWVSAAVVERKVTSKGLLVLYTAQCRTCRKRLPQAA